MSLLRSIGLSAIIAAMLTGCKTRNHAEPAGHWTLDGVTYAVAECRSSDSGSYIVTANDARFPEPALNHVTLTFGDKPASDGSMLIGDDPGQLRISVAAADGILGKEYGYVNSSGAGEKANYSFSDGKISIDIPELQIISTNGTGRKVKFSAHFAER